eukprot:749717-Hanusia_phi.AAC.2
MQPPDPHVTLDVLCSSMTLPDQFIDKSPPPLQKYHRAFNDRGERQEGRRETSGREEESWGMGSSRGRGRGRGRGRSRKEKEGQEEQGLTHLAVNRLRTDALFHQSLKVRR